MIDMYKISSCIVVCDKCSAEFLVESVNIEECHVVVDGNVFFLKYFMCPECGQVYKVFFVEEKKYNEMAEDLRLTEKRMRRLKGKENYMLLDRLQKMAMVKKNKIRRYVEFMNEKYRGTFTFASSENNQKEIVYVPWQHGI